MVAARQPAIGQAVVVPRVVREDDAQLGDHQFLRHRLWGRRKRHWGWLGCRRIVVVWFPHTDSDGLEADCRFLMRPKAGGEEAGNQPIVGCLCFWRTKTGQANARSR